MEEICCPTCNKTIENSELDNHVCSDLVDVKIEESSMDADEDLEAVEEEVDMLQTSPKKKYARKKLKEPLTCPKCDRQFFYRSYLQFHYKDVHKDAQEICQFCGKIFKNSRRLNSHLQIHKKAGEKRFRCDQCNKEFSFSGDLSRHKLIHDNIKPHACLLCTKTFRQSYALTLHVKNIHDKIKLKCDRCGLDFSCKRTLKSHMVKCSSGYTPLRNNRGPSSFVYNRSKYKCFVEGCNREYTSRKYVGVHLEKDHQMKFANFETTCLECLEVFETMGEYAVHVKIHSCNFICTMCKLRFKTDSKLQYHVSKFHKDGEDRNFVCEEEGCGARFKRAEHLRGHQLYKHRPDERKFECQQCHMKFKQRGEYNVHMRIHLDSKPFACWQCDHVCKTSSNLRQHMTIVHATDSIYCCQTCRATFKYSVDLNQHKKDHANIPTYADTEQIIYHQVN